MFKKVRFVVSNIILLIGGLIGFVLAIFETENYVNYHFFLVVFSLLGFVLSIYVVYKIRAREVKRGWDKKDWNKKEYYPALLVHSIGCIGCILFLAQKINDATYYRETCIESKLKNKLYSDPNGKKDESFALEIKFGKEIKVIYCSKKYFQQVNVNQSISICKFNSRIGFDKFVLPKDIYYN